MLSGVGEEGAELGRGVHRFRSFDRRGRLALVGTAGLHQLDVGSREPSNLALLALALEIKLYCFSCYQCDQIGRYFLSLWQQIICPNLPQS